MQNPHRIFVIMVVIFLSLTFCIEIFFYNNATGWHTTIYSNPLLYLNFWFIENVLVWLLFVSGLYIYIAKKSIFVSKPFFLMHIISTFIPLIYLKAPLAIIIDITGIDAQQFNALGLNIYTTLAISFLIGQAAFTMGLLLKFYSRQYYKI